MPPLTLDVIPGYTDLSNDALVAGVPAFGIHVEAISANAAFAKVRTEIFHGLYFHGDTVPTPVSPIDGYAYSRSECLYFYNIALSTNKDSGWIQVGSGSLWFTNWFVDQNTGQVTSLEWYRNTGSGGTRTQTNDGQIIVYTIAQRQRTSLIMSSSPVFSGVSTVDIATDKPWSQALAQSLNGDAKLAVCGHEIFYCGEYVDGNQVPLSTLISPSDGHPYSYAETKFMGFWRWTSASSAPALTQPPETLAFLGPFAWNIDSTGHVQLFMERMDNDGNDTAVHDYGRIGVMAFCTRAAVPTSSSLANQFSEVDEGRFVPGSTLRASDVLQIKRNIDEALLTPEFFDCADLGFTDFTTGSVVPLPVSPVDGYTYSRDELTYVWAWNAVRPAVLTGQVRIPVFYGGVDQSTGAVNLACWRLTDHYLDDDNNDCHIKMVVIGRRSGHPKSTIPVTTNPPPDWPTNEVVQPYSINYDMGGARTTPPAASEVLLVHIIPTLPTGMDKIKFTAGLVGSTGGCRTAVVSGYSIGILLNGATIGTMFITGTAMTFSFTVDVLLTPGDTLTFVSSDGTTAWPATGTPPVTPVIGIFFTMIGNRY
jgi:hypothetical protein